MTYSSGRGSRLSSAASGNDAVVKSQPTSAASASKASNLYQTPIGRVIDHSCRASNFSCKEIVLDREFIHSTFVRYELPRSTWPAARTPQNQPAADERGIG